jgi:predicted house-cleaning noncanonical NTP pyrophosphatase (MazG superfamily)
MDLFFFVNLFISPAFIHQLFFFSLFSKKMNFLGKERKKKMDTHHHDDLDKKFQGTNEKLVRDKIPSLQRDRGASPSVRIAQEDEEFRACLIQKLYEELGELDACIKNGALAQDSAMELVDILEVVYALGDLLGFSKERLNTLRIEKRLERGGFEKRLIWKIDTTWDQKQKF